MKILRNYILKESIGPFILSISLFNFVLIMGNLTRLAELIINKGVSPLYIGKFFLFLIPSLLSLTLPMSVLAATLITFGRLAQDNEVTAMRASGLNFLRLAMPILTIGLIFSLCLVVLNDRILPKTIYESRKLIKQIGVSSPTAYLEEGTFIKAFKKYIIYIDKIDKNSIYNIRIYEPQENRPTRTIIANKGVFIPIKGSDKIQLELYDGTSDEPDQNNPNMFYKLNFKVYKITLDLEQALGNDKMEKKPKDMTIKELKQEIEKFKKDNIDPTRYITEIHKKVSRSFSSLVFIIIGIPLALITRRGERTISFGLSLVIMVIYYLLMIGGETLAVAKIVPPVVGTWLPNTLVTLVGIILLYRTIEA